MLTLSVLWVFYPQDSGVSHFFILFAGRPEPTTGIRINGSHFFYAQGNQGNPLTTKPFKNKHIMKKIIVSIIMAIAVIASFASLASCNKNNATSDSLVGTTWTATTEMGFFTLNFTSESTFTLYVRESADSGSVTEIGTYTRNGNSVSMKSVEFSFTGSISGNSMMLTENDGYVVIFTRA